MRGKTLSLLLAAGLALAACSRSSPTPGSSPTKLTVLAAASLTQVFPEIGALFTRAHRGVTFNFSFGGTDQLAAQIQQGAPADVFAGASIKYGDQLAAANLIDPYRRFCTNQLVLITPSSNPARITSLRALSTKSYKLVIGSQTVPVGTYSRTVLMNLDGVYGPGYSASVMRNVVSNEDSVTSIVTKVELGEADAGFVYITDALAAGSRVKHLDLPAGAQAVATYPIAAVKGSRRAAAALQFVDFVLTAPAQQRLMQAGFGTPPFS
jgi:molybdate transport system substrate-binding protein